MKSLINKAQFVASVFVIALFSGNAHADPSRVIQEAGDGFPYPFWIILFLVVIAFTLAGIAKVRNFFSKK